MSGRMHTFTKACLECQGECIHRKYSKRLLRFVTAHREAFETAYLAGSASSSNEIVRLDAEYRTLPPRHDCTCWCRYERCDKPEQCHRNRHYHYVCAECKRLREQRLQLDIAPEIGRGLPPGPTMPMILMLDFAAGLMSEPRAA